MINFWQLFYGIQLVTSKILTRNIEKCKIILKFEQLFEIYIKSVRILPILL